MGRERGGLNRRGKTKERPYRPDGQHGPEHGPAGWLGLGGEAGQASRLGRAEPTADTAGKASQTAGLAGAGLAGAGWRNPAALRG